MQIDKILSVSTGHVTKEEADAFARYRPHISPKDYPEGKPMPFMIGDWGWLFHVVPEAYADDHDYDKASEGFQSVMAIARKNSCEYVRFDCDAAKIVGIPTYDW